MNRFSIAAMAALLLTGCAFVQADVSRFHSLPEKGGGQTIFLAPLEGALPGTMEFQTYANWMAPRLVSAGYRPVTDIRNADLVALIAYGLTNKETTSGSRPIFGQTGGGSAQFSGTTFNNWLGSSTYSGTIYTPQTYGVIGSVPFSETKYTRELYVSIYQFNHADPRASKQRFEGIVRSKGQSDSFSKVAACMIDALFVRFPGENGKTDSFELVDCGPGRSP